MGCPSNLRYKMRGEGLCMPCIPCAIDIFVAVASIAKLETYLMVDPQTWIIIFMNESGVNILFKVSLLFRAFVQIVRSEPLFRAFVYCKITHSFDAAWTRLCDDRLWILPWIKWIYTSLNTSFHVLMSQLSGRVIVLWRHRNILWRHQPNVKSVRHCSTVVDRLFHRHI